MARNYVASGEHFDYTATAAVASGDAVLMGATLGVSLTALAIGQTGAVRTEGVFTLPKLSTDAVVQGANLYWDNTNKRLTTTASGSTQAGRAYAAAAAGTASVQIKLNV